MVQASSSPERWLQVVGESMAPVLQSGEWVRVEWVVGASRIPRVGELWFVADPSGKVLLHRAVPHPDGVVRFKGDASGRFDSIEGVPMGRVPSARSVAQVLGRGNAFFSALALAENGYLLRAFSRLALRLLGWAERMALRGVRRSS